MALLVAPPDAEEVPEGGQVASEAPPRGTRPIGGVGDDIEDIGCETILCSDAMDASAATQSALPGFGGRAGTSPGTLPTVVILRAVRVTLEARWASATVTAAAMAARDSGEVDREGGEADRAGEAGSESCSKLASCSLGP